MNDYAYPDVLVTTDWVAENAHRDDVRLVEVNVDHDLYSSGHIPGALGWSWRSQLADQVRRDVLSPAAFARLMEEGGIEPATTVVLYGDFDNWFAAWAFWQMKLYGHRDVRMMDGGRRKWLAEGRPISVDPVHVRASRYPRPRPNGSLRAMLGDVQMSLMVGETDLVDVRSSAEFTGEVLAPPGLPETCQRGGHIPGARSVPWSMAVAEDGTFRARDELERIYAEAGITGSRPIVTYCRIGERSSHSWFVLRYLLGFDSVKNYDGSWTEWGNLVGADVETGPTTRARAGVQGPRGAEG